VAAREAGSCRGECACERGLESRQASERIRVLEQYDMVYWPRDVEHVKKKKVLGLQGALLAPIVGPVYLDSCVVSESTYNHEALARALGRRISHVSAALPGPYSLRLPRLLTCVASFASSREEVEKRIIVSPIFSVRVWGGRRGGGGGHAILQ
jgi:hypothetical protein